MINNSKSKSGKTESEEIWVNKFDEESAQEFRDKVLKLSSENISEPILVYIDSYGGYVDSLAKMIETMDEVPNPFVTICMGKAMSCGAILLSHGDIRWCGRHSRVMIHEVSGGVGAGDVHDMHNDAVEVKRLNKHFLGLLAKNCKIAGGYEGLRKVVKGKDGRDIWLDADQAVKFGIVDAVGVPKLARIAVHEVFTTPTKKNRLADDEKKKVKRK